MSTNCADEDCLLGWCAPIPGEGLEKRRSELFWQYLNSRLASDPAAEIREHLNSCEDCRAALAAERLLLACVSGGKVILARCLPGEELLEYVECSPMLSSWRRLEIQRHLDRCALCREEAIWAASHVVDACAMGNAVRRVIFRASRYLDRHTNGY